MAGAFGAYGKLPAMGDFLRAETPPGFVEVWDAWLQRAMLGARGRLGARWQECYFSAPIWRFTLAHGLAGRLPVIGILMASVDRVGRQFPLTLMAALPQGTPTLLAHLAADAVFLRLEDLALEALEGGEARALFLQRLAGLPRFAPPRDARPSLRDTTLTLRAAEAGGAAELAAALLEPRHRQPSIWSTLLRDGTRMMITEGLPGEAQTEGLFDLDAAIWTDGAERRATA